MHQTLLYNVTAASVSARGSQHFASSAAEVENVSEGSTVVTIAGSTAFEIRHRCGTTNATYGLGNPGDFGTEIYTQVEITRIS